MSSQLNDYVNEQQTMFCHIRRPGPQGWVRGRPHHQDALQAFLASPQNNNPIRIEVPHMDGGNFIAYFRRIDNELFQYTDEYNNRVDIMMCTPGRAGFINRIIDHY
jgi:hypothetical protein